MHTGGYFKLVEVPNPDDKIRPLSVYRLICHQMDCSPGALCPTFSAPQRLRRQTQTDLPTNGLVTWLFLTFQLFLFLN